MNVFHIAIDGPAGAGKSSVAKLVSKELGFTYLDTGAMYRTLGLYALRSGVAPDNGEGVLKIMPSADMQVRFENGAQRMYLNGEDVSEAIRTPEASDAASKVSAIPDVRVRMVEMQRRIAAGANVIMDGRDICMYVLPNAQLKIFLTASPEERARRRHLELRQKGIDTPYDEVLRDIIARDQRDSERAASPLAKAPDALEVDCSDMNLEQVTAEVIRLARERMADA